VSPVAFREFLQVDLVFVVFATTASVALPASATFLGVRVFRQDHRFRPFDRPRPCGRVSGPFGPRRVI
jgi:hypothetical protein